MERGGGGGVQQVDQKEETLTTLTGSFCRELMRVGKRENFPTHAKERETHEASRGDMQDGKAKASKMHQSHWSDSRKALRVQERSAAGRKSLWLWAPLQPGPRIKSEPRRLLLPDLSEEVHARRPAPPRQGRVLSFSRVVVVGVWGGGWWRWGWCKTCEKRAPSRLDASTSPLTNTVRSVSAGLPPSGPTLPLCLYLLPAEIAHRDASV